MIASAVVKKLVICGVDDHTYLATASLYVDKSIFLKRSGANAVDPMIEFNVDKRPGNSLIKVEINAEAIKIKGMSIRKTAKIDANV